MTTPTGTVIEVTHLGLDYGTVKVIKKSGDIKEYEIPLSLAKELRKIK